MASLPIEKPEPAFTPVGRSSTDLESASESEDMHVVEKLPTEPKIPPPDVGLMPWIQVLCGFFLMFNSWGILLSFGTFQSYYASGGITDQSSPSAIAWIGSIQAFLLLFAGAMGGRFFDAGYFRAMLWIGSFLIVFGMMMTSLATKYYQVLLAQGFCVGLGISMFMVPSVGLPATWFQRRRGLAVGLVTSGTSLAGIIFPIMLRELIPRIGFPWAVRAMAFISLVTLSVPLAIARQRLPPRKRGSFIEYQALREPEFALYGTGMFIAFLGFFMMYGFIQKWAIDVHLDTKGLSVPYLLAIINAAGAFGRIVPSFVSDFFGPLNVQAPSVIIAGIVVLSWIPATSIGPVIIIAILYGFFSGAIASLPPPAVASMTTDLTTLGGRLGVVFCMVSFSSLIGNPVTGAIIQSQNGGYDGARIWSGVALVTGGLIVSTSRLVKTNGKVWVKA
jgi:MFS family permease